MKSIRVVLLVAFLALTAMIGCGRSHAGKKKSTLVERLPRVEVVQPVRKRLQRRLEMAATVEAMFKVDVSARVPGVVGRIDSTTDIGRRVKTGEVLVQLLIPEMEADRDHKLTLVEQAKRQETAAAAALNVAHREVEESMAEAKRFSAEVSFNRLRLTRIKDLVRQRAQDVAVEQEATKQLEVAEAALSSNRAAITKRQAKVEASQADQELARQKTRSAEAEVRRLNELIGFATVRAPFDGVITRRWVDTGAVIKDPGAVLFTIMQMDRVRVLIDVPQRDVALLNVRDTNPNPDGRGDPVNIRMPMLKQAGHDGQFAGFLTRMTRALDPITRTMRAEIELENKDHRLQPGMFGSASIIIEDRSNVLTLPASALVRRGEGLVEVYKVANLVGDGDERKGTLKRIPVELGIDDGKEVEIRSGLKGDELVVLRATGVMRADEVVLATTDRESLVER
ncbi:MAG: efflux RND transporter periplasmic adaptor subunit [Gemmataceae bacterium]